MKTSEKSRDTVVSKLIARAEKLPLLIYVPIAYLLLISLFIPSFYLGEWLNLPETDITKLGMMDAIWYRILMVVLLGPILETFLFQAMPYYFLNMFNFMKRHAWISIVLPSIIFGSLHMISIQYFLLALMMGLVFQFTYHVRSRSGDPFLSTYLLHVLLNGMATTMSFVL